MYCADVDLHLCSSDWLLGSVSEATLIGALDRITLYVLSLRPTMKMIDTHCAKK